MDKIERITLPSDPKNMSVQFPECPRSGDQVVVFSHLGKAWEISGKPDHQVFSGLDGAVMRGNRIALTGINGAGKSTLLKVITGQTAPSEGEVTLGASVRFGYFSQYSSDVLNPNRSVFEEVSDRIPYASISSVKNILGSFQFTGDDSDKKISVLSGGEKSRVMLACMLAVPVNFLILDEPTNHLDIQSRESPARSVVSF
ncbi:ATP-binding cassette domain-containing protein [uncultured Sphaerochaeta sp.]|uniref:ATP-binding cassette domain-containing protein n=1 Tax=uncultured Sphaerochaeta sp. TaxID=886478 RepID=UPI0037488722